MKDDFTPRRLIDSASDDLTRELIEGACAETPPPERASAWLAAATAASGTAGPAAPAPPHVLAAWSRAKLLKGLLSVVTVGALGVAVAHFTLPRSGPHDPPAPHVVAQEPPSRASQSSASPDPSPPSIAVTDLPVVPPPPAVATGLGKSTPRSEPSADVPSLGPQLQRLRAAREQLQAGDASGALSTVVDYERAYPTGAFWPEAEAIAIDALVASGRTADARARAREFLRAYGDSPQAGRFKSIAGM